MADPSDDGISDSDSSVGEPDEVALIESPKLPRMIGFDSDLDDEDGMPIAKFKSVKVQRALGKHPDLRSQKDLAEIGSVVNTMQDPFIKDMEESVRKAVCKTLQVEDFMIGDRVFDYGDTGDKLYIIWKGSVIVETPKVPVAEGSAEAQTVEYVKVADYGPGKAFGELALLRPEGKRAARVTANDATKLLTLSSKDYHWCAGFSQQNFVRERVAFLRSAEKASLEGVQEVDLQAMALHLQEQHFMGEQVIVNQGAEVDRVIFVKSGFCKVMRQLHPKWREMFDTYGEKGPPPPNPFAPHGDDPTMVTTVETLSNELGLNSRHQLKQLLQWQQTLEEGSSSPRAAERDSSSSPRIGSRGLRRNLRHQTTGGADGPAASRGTSRGLREDSASGASCETVIVDLLQAGRSFGAMEMFEGLTYQCSLVAHPWAQVYVISKYDLIRNTSKIILHRLFCDYKMRLSDERLMQRLKQKSRWNSYKRDLLDDIRSRKNRNKLSIIDRRAPAPRRAGIGVLTEDDWKRVGSGEQLWHGRAQTPPMPLYTNKSGVQHVFDAQCTRGPNGEIDVHVTQERRDASLAALDEKILMTITTAKLRDRYRKQQRVGELGEQAAAIEDKLHPKPPILELAQVDQPPMTERRRHVQKRFEKAVKAVHTVRAMRRTNSPRKKERDLHPVLSNQDLDDKARKEAEEYLRQRRNAQAGRLGSSRAVRAASARRASNGLGSERSAPSTAQTASQPTGTAGSERRRSSTGRASQMAGAQIAGLTPRGAPSLAGVIPAAGSQPASARAR